MFPLRKSPCSITGRSSTGARSLRYRKAASRIGRGAEIAVDGLVLLQLVQRARPRQIGQALERDGVNLGQRLAALEGELGPDGGEGLALGDAFAEGLALDRRHDIGLADVAARIADVEHLRHGRALQGGGADQGGLCGQRIGVAGRRARPGRLAAQDQWPARIEGEGPGLLAGPAGQAAQAGDRLAAQLGGDGVQGCFEIAHEFGIGTLHPASVKPPAFQSNSSCSTRTAWPRGEVSFGSRARISRASSAAAAIMLRCATGSASL